MTDTTEVQTQPKMSLEDLLIRCTDYDDMSLSMDARELKMLKQHIALLQVETPAPDIAEIKAQGVEQLANEFYGRGYVYDTLKDYATKLRAGRAE